MIYAFVSESIESIVWWTFNIRDFLWVLDSHRYLKQFLLRGFGFTSCQYQMMESSFGHQDCGNYFLFEMGSLSWIFNPLSANPTEWPNTLKQFVGYSSTHCLSVFDHFVGSALKGLMKSWIVELQKRQIKYFLTLLPNPSIIKIGN